MNVILGLAIRYARYAECHVCEPGAPDPHAASTMADGLRRLKWDIFAPGTMPPPPTPTLTEVVAMARSQGCVVVLPGEPMPEPTLSAALTRLDQIEARVLLPGNMIVGATDILTTRGCTVLLPGEVPEVSLERATEVAAAHGYAVRHLPHPPELGLWDPADNVKHPARTVTATDNSTVHYVSNGERGACPVLTFWAWRKRAEATHQPASVF